jgi:hypothetical protein
MATRILEYGGTGLLGPAYPVVPAGQCVTKQPAMTATGTSAKSAAFKAATGLVIVQSDEQIYCEVAADADAVATGDSYRIAAGAEQAFSVTPGAGWKVAIKT